MEEILFDRYEHSFFQTSFAKFNTSKKIEQRGIRTVKPRHITTSP